MIFVKRRRDNLTGPARFRLHCTIEPVEKWKLGLAPIYVEFEVFK